MARSGPPRKLSDADVAEAFRRKEAGESVRAIARSFGVDEKTLRNRLAALDIKGLAVDMVAAELQSAEVTRRISALPKPAQEAVYSLAEQLKDISASMARSAASSARTSAIFSSIAQLQAEKVDQVDPLGADSAKAFMDAVNLQKAANVAAEIPLGMMSANKEVVKKLNEEEDQPPTPTQIVFQVVDASDPTLGGDVAGA